MGKRKRTTSGGTKTKARPARSKAKAAGTRDRTSSRTGGKSAARTRKARTKSPTRKQSTRRAGAKTGGATRSSAGKRASARSKTTAPRARRRSASKSARTASKRTTKKKTSIKSAPPPRGERKQALSAARRRYAQRIVSTQQQAALLTAFDEVDLGQVQTLRTENQELFRSRYGVGLGLVSFFVRAAVRALRILPELNAVVRGDKLVLRVHQDIGIAFDGENGPVTPVLRDAGRVGFPEIERTLSDFEERARTGALKDKEQADSTFTIRNGGSWGSMLATPVLGPEQTGALGLYSVQNRPVVREGAIVVRPMMYVALTYDHRVVNDRQAVDFLRQVREAVEDPMLHLM